jgi:hypothetical protein
MGRAQRRYNRCRVVYYGLGIMHPSPRAGERLRSSVQQGTRDTCAAVIGRALRLSVLASCPSVARPLSQWQQWSCTKTVTTPVSPAYRLLGKRTPHRVTFAPDGSVRAEGFLRLPPDPEALTGGSPGRNAIARAASLAQGRHRYTVGLSRWG